MMFPLAWLQLPIASLTNEDANETGRTSEGGAHTTCCDCGMESHWRKRLSNLSCEQGYLLYRSPNILAGLFASDSGEFTFLLPLILASDAWPILPLSWVNGSHMSRWTSQQLCIRIVLVSNGHRGKFYQVGNKVAQGSTPQKYSDL